MRNATLYIILALKNTKLASMSATTCGALVIFSLLGRCDEVARSWSSLIVEAVRTVVVAFVSSIFCSLFCNSVIPSSIFIQLTVSAVARMEDAFLDRRIGAGR